MVALLESVVGAVVAEAVVGIVSASKAAVAVPASRMRRRWGVTGMDSPGVQRLRQHSTFAVLILAVGQRSDVNPRNDLDHKPA
ncbi:hypothetical protein TPA0598_03_05570 [Streptomyces lydicamycinicus]|uniref:Uncharacterized protein n=1 Tax=Streptomyces lydicamycinicus TaxID=1546107 RepID=A0A0P4R5K7_9ACTN|nr:hypothetical protein TPA0598_03_05570 [Streptomyces lydicamycinicus]